MKQPDRIHSMAPVIDSQAQVLILGSMPGVKSLEAQHYYGNPRNHFWQIIFSLLGEDDPVTYEDRLTLLKKHHVALWDVIHSCYREGSLDSAIKEEYPNDLNSLLREHPEIKAIAFNGGKAFRSYKKHFGLDEDSGLVYLPLPSTSPMRGKHVKTLPEKLEAWSVLEEYL
ncbi:G/U mismatch-specific uracil-DNA glycosylase [Trichococcus patagoniensis]|uniref:G/U mismatch-specific uracil-DNA glycosylase n=1 Tax=Trichococcus patagoniensis TaxID=382641 RepID=A0A2T5IPN5_9LACT|nr:DNA-deoxyinosine glycosylase [Trichococcus patagoniensis]PTQ85778.1 G/U mismatch-specific uracil-DNA glycosylase [Trichococcus patagoniensis]